MAKVIQTAAAASAARDKVAERAQDVVRLAKDLARDAARYGGQDAFAMHADNLIKQITILVEQRGRAEAEVAPNPANPRTVKRVQPMFLKVRPPRRTPPS